MDRAVETQLGNISRRTGVFLSSSADVRRELPGSTRVAYDAAG